MASRLGPSVASAWEPRDRLYAALAAAAAFLAFLPALRAGFVWDDAANLLENPGFRSLDLRHLRWMFTTTYMGPYQPLSWLSLGLDYKLWGMRPLGFHLTNLLLHAANAALFFAVSRRILAALFAQAPAHRLRLGALAAALFFGVHPLRAESVAWVTERRDVLSGLFYLAATAAYLRRRLHWALALFMAGLLSKASGVTLPLAWLVLDWRPFERFRSRVLLKEAVVEKIPFFWLTAVFSALAVLGQWRAGNLTGLQAHGLSARAAQTVASLAFYVEKTLCPMGLSPLYALPKTLPLFGAKTAAAVFLLAAVAVVLRRLGLAWKDQAGLWIFYLLLLLPVCGLLQNGPQLAADRYSYLSCLGWALLAGTYAVQASDPRPAATPMLVVAFAAVLGAGSWRRAEAWRDNVTLWETAVRTQPESPAVLANDGLALAANKRLPEALSRLERACELEPGNASAWTDKGYVLLEMRSYAQAELALRRAQELDGDYPPAQTYLGVALFEQGKPEEAVPYFRRAVELKPGWAPAHDNLEAAMLAAEAKQRGRARRK